MAVSIPSNGRSIAEMSEIPLSPSHPGHRLPFFKLVSEDIILNIFSRLEEDPRHHALLACVCIKFANVVRNVCWRRQCTRIVPELLPSPQTHLDQLPDPPGGWGALLKLLVCCPGLKHAGVVPECWDFGLERELGPSEFYEVQPRYSSKISVKVDNVEGTGSGEAILATGDASVQCNREFNDSGIGVDQNCATGSAQVEKLAVAEMNGKSLANDPSATADVSVQCSRELGDSSLGIEEKFAEGSGQVEMLALAEKNDKSLPIDPSANLKVLSGDGRPPRKPTKKVHWKEEDLKDEQVGSKLRPAIDSGKIVTERGRSRKRKERAVRKLLSRIPEDSKQQLHLVTAEWNLSREEGSRLLASRFRTDSLYVCDWPGCVHPGEKRNYKLFRGFFKNFKTSLLWRNLKDMKAKQTNIDCAFCSSAATWDMMTAFCLRRSFEYHDDGEPVVHASVCENGHVSGAWTDRPGVHASL